MASICINCVKDADLAALICEYGVVADICKICRTTNVKSLDCQDSRLRNLIRALVRYNYSEWEYNPHCGGDVLEKLLLNDNPIMACNPKWDEGYYEDALLSFFNPGYEDYEKGVSLFSGYDEDGHQLSLLVALKEDFDPSLRFLRKKLLEKNYFLFENEVASLLKPHISRLERFLKSGEALHRSRIGFESKGTPLVSGWGNEWHYKPYSGKSLGAPQPYLAGGGRLNRPGVSFLYLATDENTAISEVRPHPGHYVSIGQYKSVKQLRIADFNAISLRDFSSSDASLDHYRLLKSIDNLFSFPIPPEERRQYSFTQFLSDALRHLGFDGIGYKSSIGTGNNFAFFDPDSFIYVENSARTIKVEQLNYKFAPTDIMSPDCEYSNINGEIL